MNDLEKAKEILDIRYASKCHHQYLINDLIKMAEWKDEGFLEWLKEINTYSLKDKSKYIKLAIEKLENKMKGDDNEK